MRVLEPLRHDAVIRRLLQAAVEGRLPHALLFEGAEGIGKFEAARWLAQGLLCAEGPAPPCGTCGPCKRVTSGGPRGNHPDLFLLDPHDPALRDDFERSPQIRIHRIAYRPDAAGVSNPEDCVESFLDLASVEGRYRPVLLRECHRMNEAAQNALLKTLEEPRPGTVLILETHRPERLLPTLRSRCVRVRFDPLDEEECTRVLEREGIAHGSASLARLSGGSPGVAARLVTRDAPGLRALFLSLLAGESGPLEVAAAVQEHEGDFGPGKPTEMARERARFALDLLLALVRDRMAVAHGVDPSGLRHGDVVGGLPPRGPAALADDLQRILAARRDVDANLGPEALLERALLAAAGRRPTLGRR